MEKNRMNHPPFTEGEKVIWHGGSPGLGNNLSVEEGIYHGKICWIGKMKEFQNKWVTGIEMEKSIKGGTNGTWGTRHIFSCKSGHGVFILAEDIQKSSSLPIASSVLDKKEKEKGFFKMKEKKNLATKEINKTSVQNGPGSPKLSPGKGGTIFNKEINVNNSTNNSDHDTPLESLNSKKTGSCHSVKSVFGSMTKKEKKIQSSTSQEIVLSIQEQVKPHRGRFLNIFKWFTKKDDLKQKKSSMEKMSGRGVGSTTSLVSDSSSIAFFPIRHSVSADNSNTMMKSYDKSVSSVKGAQPQHGIGRRNSSVSTHSNISLNSSSSRAKKRLAPRPPDSVIGGKNNSAIESDNGSSSANSEKKREQVQNEDSLIYGKIKRKAPQPPITNKSPGSTKFCTSAAHSVDNSMRPLSTFSNFSSVSHSGSSTLQSSTCSENDSLTLKSDISLSTTSSFPLNRDSKGPLSPKPWYKRKKIKDKSHKSKKDKVNNAYESWMPDIQYSRQNVNAAETCSLQDKNIETFFDRGPQVGQRFSILSSISDLDRAATEQFEREKAKKNASKTDKGATFYTNSSPHILCQKDLVPSNEEPQGAVGLCNDVKNIKTTTYDNLHYSNENNSLLVSYSMQPTLKLNDSERTNFTQPPKPNAPEISLYDSSMEAVGTSKYYDEAAKVNYEEYLEEIRKELEQENLENSQNSRTRSTPKEKAIFDPELFYQLAKDAKVNSESKTSTSTKQIKENEVKSKENTNSVIDRSSYNFRLRSHKNFGFRMNNFFTPDVSTILEGSESVTSSNATTTPADDFNEDVVTRSAFSTDFANDFMSINSDLNSEYRINTSNLQELIESFALDLRRSDLEENGGPSREGEGSEISRKTKADKIREEVLLLREKDNFLMWQRRMQETELTKEDDETTIQERKKKWVCDSCTLINQPWRLHCEACGSLRPPNPKRIDGENMVLNSPGTDSSLNSASNDSPVTVIHDDQTVNDTFNDSPASESRIQQGHSYRTSDTDVTPNLNWETELQSYFTQFDDHTNAIKRIDSGNRGQAARQSTRAEDSNAYGKIIVSRNKVTQEGRSAATKEQTQNLIVNGENDIDVQEMRRARIRKFQLSYSSSQESQNLSSNPLRQYHDKKEYFGSGIQEKISQLSDLSSRGQQHSDEPTPECSNQAQRLRDPINVFPNNEEKQFYKNEFKKSPVLKPSGAVKNVVSIFNQLDQIKAAQEKPPPVKINKRRSFNNILNFSDFERLISGTNSEVASNLNPPQRTNSPVMADIDIASAISKFDEMAALAEINNIRKPVSKIQKKWLQPKSLLTTENNGEANESKSEETEDLHTKTRADVKSGDILNYNHTNTPVLLRTETTANGIKKADNRDSCDSIIRDGFLYTTGEARRRSMSIGSGTFELMNARDFASIEAHHSRRPSPCEDFDSLSALELSHPLLMPEILVPSASYSEENSFNVNASDEQIEIQEELETDPGNAVDRLSRQLTEVEGIETFKATLARDGSKLGENNTKTISRLLKKLEFSISSGQHEEASRLAHDLAKMRLECSVTNKAIKGEEENSSLQQLNVSDLKKGSSKQENTTELNKESVAVIKRVTKTSSHRREVKSDTASLGIVNVIPPDAEEINFRVKMYVEDKASHQGPIILELQAAMTVGDLKLKVSEEFGFPVEVQRWILGRLLADDDSKTLSNYKVTAEGCPIFLYLVAPDTDTKPTSPNMSRSSSYKSYTRSDSDFKPEVIIQKSVENTKETTQPFTNGAEPCSSQSIKQKIINHVKKDKGGKSTKVKTSQKSSAEAKLSTKANASPKIVQKKLKINANNEHNRVNESINLPSNINGWICPQCTLINHKDRPGCEACATERPETHSNVGQKKNLRQAVFALEAQGCVANQEPFDCLVCLSTFNEGEGVILRDCLHVFCRYCLTAAVKYSDTAMVKCPFSDKNYSCQFSLQEREIKDLLSEDEYKKHLDKSVKEAAGSMKNVFYCMTPDCKGFCQIEDNVNVFLCAVCSKANCLTCQAQHGGQTCRMYQDELQHKQDEDALKTKKFFDDIIRRGDGMPCPQCSIMLVRKWGCDWMRCPMCRTEICWVTRMPRWGPEGQGDTSGGCKCGLNGRKCHPKCTYCH